MAKVLLGVTGSVAAIKTPDLYEALRKRGHDVRIVATTASLYFFDPLSITKSTERDRSIISIDEDEWPDDRYQRGDRVLHIDLRDWADVLVIAPLDANTLAKLAIGMSDNCLTCVCRAWDMSRRIVVAPAMNTMMWQHPMTRRHLRQLACDHGAAHIPSHLDEDGIINMINERSPTLRIVPPVVKELACGTVGVGAMADVERIAEMTNDE